MIKKVNSHIRRPSVVFTFFLSACVIVGCVQNHTSDTTGITGTDDIGRIITLKQPAQRIVLLTGSPTDALFELGTGASIIGITDNFKESYPATCKKYPTLLSLPKLGGRSAPNVEAILALKPDLILVSGSGDNPEKNAIALKKAGLTYAIMKSFENIDAGLAQIRRLGILCGRNVQGYIIASDLLSEINAKKLLIKTSSVNRPHVYFWWGSGNGTYGSGTALSELISSSGGTNIADSVGKDFFDLSPEYVVKSNPDIIVFSYWREQDKESRITELRSRPGFKSLNAVRTGRIYGIDGHLIHSAMMFPQAMDSLSRWIHPELAGNKPVITGTDVHDRIAIVDDCDRTVLVSTDPRRIVSLATSDVEILFTLGVGSRLCGVPDGIKFPPEAIPIEKIGGMYGGFSAEKIVGKKPDLILLTMSNWGQYHRNLDVLEKYGLTTLGLQYPRNFYETIAQIRRIGLITGQTGAAIRLADSLILRKDRVMKRTLPLDSASRPRVYIEWISGDGGQGTTCGNTDRNHAIITMAGGINIFSDNPKNFFKAVDEEVIARNPEVIIITTDTTKFHLQKIRESVRGRSGWQRTDAVKNNAIYVIDAQLTWANPRMIEGIENIAAILHPELFK